MDDGACATVLSGVRGHRFEGSTMSRERFSSCKFDMKSKIQKHMARIQCDNASPFGNLGSVLSAGDAGWIRVLVRCYLRMLTWLVLKGKPTKNQSLIVENSKYYGFVPNLSRMPFGAPSKNKPAKSSSLWISLFPCPLPMRYHGS